VDSPLNVFRDSLRARGIHFREFGHEPDACRLLVLFGEDEPGPHGIKAFKHAVAVDFVDGRWMVGPPMGDPKIHFESFSSVNAALAATLSAIGRDA